MPVSEPPEQGPGRPPLFATRAGGNYDLIAASFCALLLISNIGATKLISFGPVIVDGGAFLFPLTYIAGDVLSEVYGFRSARRTILLGFALQVLASLTLLAVQASPPAAEWHHQAAYEAVLGFVPRIVLASIAGYVIGQLLNSYVLVWLKRRFGERHLWVRLIGSTVVGEAADTVTFCLVAFAGILTGWNMVTYIAVGYVYKCLLEVVLLPVTYQVIKVIKRHEPSLAAAA